MADNSRIWALSRSISIDSPLPPPGIDYIFLFLFMSSNFGLKSRHFRKYIVVTLRFLFWGGYGVLLIFSNVPELKLQKVSLPYHSPAYAFLVFLCFLIA